LTIPCNVSLLQVGKLEAARAAPDIDLVDRLAKALGTTIADLLPETAPQDPLPVLRE
jgi:transcriptional regulator with XRE-family HTH domain